MRPKTSRSVPENQDEWGRHLQNLTDDIHSAFTQGQINISQNLPMEYRSIRFTSERKQQVTGTKPLAGMCVLSSSSPIDSQFIKPLPGGKLEVTIKSDDQTVVVGALLIYREGLQNE